MLFYFTGLRTFGTTRIRFVRPIKLLCTQACTSFVRVSSGLVYGNSSRKSFPAPNDGACFLGPFGAARSKLVFCGLLQFLDLFAFLDPFLQVVVSTCGFSTFIEEEPARDFSHVQILLVIELSPFVQGEELLRFQTCDIICESAPFELARDEGSAGVFSCEAAISVSRCVELSSF